MVVTWSDTRNTLRGDLWRSAQGVPDNVCDRWLHTSLRELEGERRWIWLEQVAVAWTADQGDVAFITMPDSLTEITTLAYCGPSGDDYETLTPAPIQVVRELAKYSSPGRPTAYCRAMDGTTSLIYLDTVVADDDVFEFVGSARTPVDLADAIADFANNRTLQREQQAVLSLACHYVALNYLKDETNAARHRATYDRHLDRLIDEEERARGDQTGGGILPDTYYSDAAYGTSPHG